MRICLLLAAAASLAGCVPPVSSSQLLADSAYDMNVATRFGRMDVAMDFVGEGARAAFTREHADWGKELRVVDVELLSLDIGAKDQASVVLSVLWQRLDEAQTRTTQLTQSWQDGRGGWRMISEKRSGGDQGLLGERPKPAVSAEPGEIARAPQRSGFQTTIIRATD